MSIVLRFSVVLPAAPYVTETNVGLRRDSSASARPRLRSPSSVFGGKNSKENDGSLPEAIRSSIRTPLSLGGAPAHRVLAVAAGEALRLQVLEVGERHGQRPGGRRRRVLAALNLRQELVRRRPAARLQGGADAVEPAAHQGAVGVDMTVQIGER